MLGEHQGLTPLGQDERDAVAGGALRAMGRMKAGKDVPQRRKLIARSLAAIPETDAYWLEALASGLAGADGVGAAEAQVAALAGAWEIRDGEIATFLREVNANGSDPFSRRALQGLINAAPEFGKRLVAMKIDTDEPMIRVSLAHIFRRDAGNTMQMFIADAAARQLPRAFGMSLGAFVKKCLERYDEQPSPVGAWGYVLVLHDMSGKAGYFLFEPDEAARTNLTDMKKRLTSVMGEIPDDQMRAHLLASAVSGYLRRGQPGAFAALTAAVFQDMGIRYGVIYAREDEAGTFTDLSEIPAESVEEARRKANKLPHVTMHDDFRAMTEMLSQMRDAEDMQSH